LIGDIYTSALGQQRDWLGLCGHVHGGPSYLFNSGGGYRITPTQQIDFHIGIGLNDNAPAYIFGIGYSFRLDGLF
jgi:hypothetical protein